MVSIPLNTETEPQHTGLSSPRNIWYSGRLWRCHKLFELTILCQQHLKDRIGLVLQNFRKHWHCRAIPPILTPTDGQSNLTPIAAHSWHTARAMVLHADSMASPTHRLRSARLSLETAFPQTPSARPPFHLCSAEKPPEFAPGFLASRSTRLRPWSLRDGPLRSTRPRFLVPVGSVPPAGYGRRAGGTQPRVGRALAAYGVALQWRGFLEKG